MSILPDNKDYELSLDDFLAKIDVNSELSQSFSDIINFSKEHGTEMGKCWLNTVVYSNIPLEI